jgi:hypothetical protein
MWWWNRKEFAPIVLTLCRLGEVTSASGRMSGPLAFTEGKAGRLTYSRQAGPDCSGAAAQAPEVRRDALQFIFGGRVCQAMTVLQSRSRKPDPR